MQALKKEKQTCPWGTPCLTGPLGAEPVPEGVTELARLAETGEQRPSPESARAPANSRMLTPPFLTPARETGEPMCASANFRSDSSLKGRGQTGPKMAASRYRRFLKLCEEWPVDETKRGRDLGAYLRQRVAQAFREGENTQVTGLWGPPAAGWRLGRGAERTRHGRG